MSVHLSSGRCRCLLVQRHVSVYVHQSASATRMLSSTHTITTSYYTASGMTYCDVCSLYRMLQLAWYLEPMEPTGQTTSSDASTCVVPRTQTGFGYRTFQVTGPKLWNSLSVPLRQSDMTICKFNRLLKIHLFAWDCGALVTFVFIVPRINVLTHIDTLTRSHTHCWH